MKITRWTGALAVTGLLAIGCADEGPETLSVSDGDFTKVEPGKEDSSAVAVFLDFEMSGELVTSSSFGAAKQVEEQMLYTIGQLNGERAVGRLDKLVVSNVETERLDSGKTLVTYDATLLVAWGKKDNVPASYTLQLPRDVSFTGLESFTDKYNHDCVDFGAHDVTAGSMWYYYRPKAFRCDLDGGDIVEIEARVSVSDVNTTGKYPEYDKIWEDGAFHVVAVWGKYEDDATTSSDAGIAAYNNFHSLISDLLESQGPLVTLPDSVPTSPGVGTPEIRYEVEIDADHRVVVTSILVDNVRTAGFDFDQRYEELSRNADLILYNGHAGLGANIRALANKGDWQTGQYAVVFMNGCDTYAYVDSALFDAHAAVNSDDPSGTKYVDIITNAMPSFFRSMPRATIALVDGLIQVDDPLTFEQIFKDIDSSQIVLVSGEQDNTFVPGGGGDVGTPDWPGIAESASVRQDEEFRFETPSLEPGTYTFEITGDGDADLYVRVGLEPNTRKYDCRPFRASSRERCELTLTSSTVIHGMVRGWASQSNFDLVAQKTE